MTPDTNTALKFLEQYSPGHVITLSAITLGRAPSLNGIAMSPQELATTGYKFIERYNGKANIYFGVNPPKKGLNIKKAKKTDIEFLTHLHIDIDPAEGRLLGEERKRILEKLSTFDPEPTIIIDSGGGYQGFWKLKEEVKVENIVELERYNIELSQQLGGDECHNIDRIMRLPGTINIPTPTKVRRGRVEALASVVHFKPTLLYRLSDFTPSAGIVISLPKKTRQIKEESKGELNINADALDALNISNRTRELIIHGNDPEETDRWPSRSECLFHVVCRLVREEQTDDTIYSLITNPKFGVSASVLDASNQREYGEKQIQRARESVLKQESEALSKLSKDQRKSVAGMNVSMRIKALRLEPGKLEALLELNDKHCVIRESGKVRVLNEEYDPVLKRNVITRSTFEDLRNYYSNRFIETQNAKGDLGMTKLGRWWLSHSLRRQHEKLLFLPLPPGEEIKQDPQIYNLFRGYSVEPRKEGKWSLFRAHILENICGGNEKYYNYLIGWMANAVQNPARPGQVAIVLKGEKGTGKSKFAKVFGNLFGQHFLHVGNPKHLIGNFNQHLRDAIIVFADEAIWAGDKQGESVLKMLVTEETLLIERKGIDIINCPNFIHLLMASNHDWVVPAGNQERRYFVLNVSNDRAQDSKFFGELSTQMSEGGNEAFLYYLWKYDLSNFDLRKVPHTEALESQQALSLTPHQGWWENKLLEGCTRSQERGWEEEVRKDDMWHDYINEMKNQGVVHRLGRINLANFLKSMMSKSENFRDRQIRASGGERPYVFNLPPLEECRKLYEKYTRRKYNWTVKEK